MIEKYNRISAEEKIDVLSAYHKLYCNFNTLIECCNVDPKELGIDESEPRSFCVAALLEEKCPSFEVDLDKFLTFCRKWNIPDQLVNTMLNLGSWIDEIFKPQIFKPLSEYFDIDVEKMKQAVALNQSKLRVLLNSLFEVEDYLFDPVSIPKIYTDFAQTANINLIDFLKEIQSELYDQNPIMNVQDEAFNFIKDCVNASKEVSMSTLFNSVNYIYAHDIYLLKTNQITIESLLLERVPKRNDNEVFNDTSSFVFALAKTSENNYKKLYEMEDTLTEEIITDAYNAENGFDSICDNLKGDLTTYFGGE